MFNQLLPRQIDNTFHGSRIALWLFVPLVLVKAAISVNSIVNGRLVASSADGIPLETFTPAGVQAVVSLFAIWGISQLMICLLGVLVLVRYRAMIPFMFALLLLEHLGRKLVLHFLPVVTTGTPPGYAANLVLVSLMIVGLALSVWRQDHHQGSA
jgi:hypothetical protein